MSGSAFAILVLLTIAITVSAFCHATIRPFIGASAASALFSTVLFQLAVYMELGHLDPFILISIVTGAFYAFVISLPVGLVTRAIRRNRPPTTTVAPKQRRHSHDDD